jgi:lipopolysaccharide/colanic/teichoic acid biosynthesis glycosyltransferase
LIRRSTDILLSLLGLTALAVVILVVSVAIYAQDGRPVFFWQKRVGRFGRIFDLVKFRSMRLHQGGSLITAKGDPRTTPVGRWLRLYKLDELPQLWNVLRGDMSLIGPRPEVPRYVDLSKSVWQRILTVRPGITDKATLLYRDEEEILSRAVDPEREYKESILPAKLALNLQYLESRTFGSDLMLLWLTVRYSLFRSQFNTEKVRHIAIS